MLGGQPASALFSSPFRVMYHNTALDQLCHEGQSSVEFPMCVPKYGYCYLTRF